MNILIADNDRKTQVVLSNLLAAQSCNLFTATDGDDAYLQIHRNNIDLVLCELNLPGMHAFELIERINMIEKFGVKFILLGEFRLQETILKAMNMGVKDFIARPFELSQVRYRLLNALKQTKTPEWARLAV